MIAFSTISSLKLFIGQLDFYGQGILLTPRLLTFAIGILLVVIIRSMFYAREVSGPTMDEIPSTCGSTGLSKIIGMIQLLTRPNVVLRNAYGQVKNSGGLFKAHLWDRWIVFITTSQYINEVNKARDDVLSTMTAIDKLLQLSYVISPQIVMNPYHFGLVHPLLGRNLELLIPEILEETQAAFESYIGNGGEIPAVKTLSKFICRISNGIFIGSPVCRDEAFTILITTAISTMVVTGHILSYFPKWVRRLAARCLGYMYRVHAYIQPLIEERRISEQPRNDLLSALMHAASQEGEDDMSISMRIFHLNFAAVHTTTLLLTHIFYSIASNSAWKEDLRKEVIDVVNMHGWTQTSLSQMVKLDSFMKEVLRYHGIASVALPKIAMTTFTFSDGREIPPGTQIWAPSCQIHFDDEIWPNASTFDPLRFCRNPSVVPQTVVSTSPEFLAWGHGRHACPGRFLAACELKLIVSYALMNYDFHLKDGNVRPPDEWWFTSCWPNSKGILVFERRGPTLDELVG